MKKEMNEETKKVVDQVTSKAISKSEGMRQLYDQGLELREIADAMGVRYQFVYNAVSNYCRIEGTEIRTGERGKGTGPSKKDQIIELLKAGKTKTEISTELKCYYNYVYNVEKNYEKAKQK